MTLKVRILRCSRRLFIILVSITMTWFSEKMLIFNICRNGLIPNLIKKSWTVSSRDTSKLFYLISIINELPWFYLSSRAFKNYVDQILPFLTTYLLTPGWHLSRNFFTVSRENLHIVDIFRNTYLPHLVNIVFEQPLDN